MTRRQIEGQTLTASAISAGDICGGPNVTFHIDRVGWHYEVSFVATGKAFNRKVNCERTIIARFWWLSNAEKCKEAAYAGYIWGIRAGQAGSVILAENIIVATIAASQIASGDSALEKNLLDR